MSNGAASRLHSRVGALLQALLALGQSLVLADSHVCVSVWQLTVVGKVVVAARKERLCGQARLNLDRVVRRLGVMSRETPR